MVWVSCTFILICREVDVSFILFVHWYHVCNWVHWVKFFRHILFFGDFWEREVDGRFRVDYKRLFLWTDFYQDLYKFFLLSPICPLYSLRSTKLLYRLLDCGVLLVFEISSIGWSKGEEKRYWKVLFEVKV